MNRNNAGIATITVLIATVTAALAVATCSKESRTIPLVYTCAPNVAGLVMYSSLAMYTGDLGGRAGADGICDGINLTSLAEHGVISNKHAFLSVDEASEIQDLPGSFGYPEDVPVFGPDGCTKIADSWSDLLDGSIDRSLKAASVLPGDEDWWSGSSSSGILGDNCSGFDSADSGIQGMKGSDDSKNDLWLTDSKDYCDVPHFFLCIAEFEPAP